MKLFVSMGTSCFVILSLSSSRGFVLGHGEHLQQRLSFISLPQTAVGDKLGLPVVLSFGTSTGRAPVQRQRTQWECVRGLPFRTIVTIIVCVFLHEPEPAD